jgi:hypothetical protein
MPPVKEALSKAPPSDSLPKVHIGVDIPEAQGIGPARKMSRGGPEP